MFFCCIVVVCAASVFGFGTMERLQDRKFPSDILCLSHSPTMDLIAISTESNNVGLYRSVSSDFHRLFNADIGINLGVTCIVWGVKGKVMAFGGTDGSVAIYSVETGQAVHRPLVSQPRGYRIISMHWVFSREGERGGAGAVHARRYSKGVPRSVLSKRPATSGSGLATYGGDNDSFRHSHLVFETADTLGVYTDKYNVLVFGDAASNVTFSAFGFFPVGCVDLSGAFETITTDSGAPLKLSLPEIDHVALSSNFKFVSCIMRSRVLHNGAGDAASDDVRYHFLVVDTGVLAKKQREITFLSRQSAIVGALLLRVEEALRKMESLWRQGVKLFLSKIKELRELLVRYGVSGTIKSELFILLTSGIFSPALAHFFSNSLSASIVKRMKRAFSSSCLEIETICNTQLARASEEIVFSFGEILSALKWPGAFSELGIGAQEILKPFGIAKRMVLCGEQFLSAVRHAKRYVLTFYAWVEYMVETANTEQDHAETRGISLGGIEYNILAKLLSPVGAELSMEEDVRGSRSSQLESVLHGDVDCHFSSEKKADNVESGDNNSFMPWASKSTQAKEDKPAAKDTSTPTMRKTLVALQTEWGAFVKRPSAFASKLFRPVVNLPLCCTANPRSDIALQSKRGRRNVGFKCKFYSYTDDETDQSCYFFAFANTGGVDPGNKIMYIAKYNVTKVLDTHAVHGTRKRSRQDEDRVQDGDAESTWEWQIVGLQFSEALVDLDFYDVGAKGDTEQSRLAVLLEENKNQNEGGTVGMVDFNTLMYTSIKFPFGTSNVPAKENILKKIKRENIELVNVNGDSEFVDRWFQVSSLTSGFLHACGSRGTLSLTIGKNRLQVFDAEDDGEEDDDSMDEDD